ncbi:hypothetical protein A9Q90_02620 [Gammaproteobacteria bacterium 54_18_T64]|nr:hypothetical protein A9Q90_02620 [Gammaproteobacteria bacterium 54_18_T64]
MDQGTLQGIGTLLAMLAFSAVCVWAYSARNKARFEEAAQLPFVDELPRAKPQMTADAGSEASESRVDLGSQTVESRL